MASSIGVDYNGARVVRHHANQNLEWGLNAMPTNTSLQYMYRHRPPAAPGRFGLAVLLPFAVLGAAFWAATTGAAPAPTKTPRSPLIPLYHQQFIYGMARIESGTATVALPPAAKPGRGLLPIGTTITTGADQAVQLRLGCGSTLRLGPSSRLELGQFGLILHAGCALARHLGTVFPLKISGAATLLLTRDSVVDIEREAETVRARVQVGTVRTPGLREPARAGAAIEASGRTASTVARGPIPRGWIHPGLGTAAIGTDPLSAIDLFAGPDTDVTTLTSTPTETGTPASTPGSLHDVVTPANTEAAGEADAGFLRGDGSGS